MFFLCVVVNKSSLSKNGGVGIFEMRSIMKAA